MGILTPGNKRGVGAALLSIGDSLTEQRLAKEEKARHEEASAKEERRLQLQEQEAAQRRELNELNIQMKKAQWNNQQLMKAVSTSEFDETATAEALTKYMPDGLVWSHDKLRSSDDEIIFNIGAYEKKGAGVDGTGGVPTPKALAGGMSEKRFTSDDQYTAKEKFVNWVVAQSNPSAFLGMQMQNIQGDEQLRRSQKIHNKRMKEDPVYAKRFGEEQQLGALGVQQAQANVEKTQAETAKLKREPKDRTTPAQAPVSTFKSFTGKEVKQTAKDVEKAKQFASALNKSGLYEVTLDADDAARISNMKNDPKAQKLINNYRKQIKAGEMTLEEFSDKFAGTDLPQEFVTQMYERAEGMTSDSGSFWSFIPFVD